MVNSDRLELLAQQIEREDARQFNMRNYVPEIARWMGRGSASASCNSACCIAGHALARWEPEAFKQAQRKVEDAMSDSLTIFSVTRSIHEEAAELLGLDEELADVLFAPEEAFESLSAITPGEAAQALRAVASGKRTMKDVWGHAEGFQEEEGCDE